MTSPLFLFSISGLICLFVLSLQRKHLLMSLLTLEAFILSMAILIPMSIMFQNQVNGMFAIVLLTMGACEASLGLSLLVLMTRSYGNDLLKSITKNLC
uniref:NADH-ubiquinone oxidoreductase chain 4L n=1 Tax=Urechis caupo TaxID=6431 RepID=Q5YA36_URECA|nr:NADH dehydrogenase subunit 4L [Urechis caupo]AAT12183.1 NADH dehydrogenase subunit 4L [Urechis caupo]